MITQAQLHQAMPRLSPSLMALYLPCLNAALQAYGFDTVLRTAAFTAQLAHESAEFRFMEELWGPIAAQLRYEPPGDLAARLGNTQPGDGKRFKGRGALQITGRFNYKKYGDLLGIDLVGEPQRAAQADVAFATAGLFWKTNGLNELADAEQFVTITRRINGGTNGLADRQRYYALAKAALANGFVPNPPAALSRGASSPAAPVLPNEPLTRGFEAIAEALKAAAPRRASRRRIDKPAV